MVVLSGSLGPVAWCSVRGPQNRVLWYRYYSQRQAIAAVRGEAGVNEKR